jgi:fructosamine-3-kinase
MTRIEDAKAAVAKLTGRAPIGARRLGGTTAFEIRLDGGTVFAKTAPDTMPGAIAAEAASLAWLAESTTVSIPELHGHDEHWLVIDHLPACAPSALAAEDFGRRLAHLHAAGAPAFGAPPPGGPIDAWIGLAPMRDQTAPDWPTFYATYRVEPYLRQAVDSSLLSTVEGDVISRVCTRIDELAGPAEPPARLHGDLWNGNVRWSDDRAWLIDPAAHGGHRETDLAMLRLFGCPYLERILDAYQEIHPLADGWRDRVGLHQLFPLLVHTVLFGGGFAAQAVAAARSAEGA